MLPKGRHEGSFGLDFTQSASGVEVKFFRSARAEVSHHVRLPVAPHILNGVEFWRVGGQPLNPDAPLLRRDPILYRTAAMSWQIIPDHQQAALELTLKLPEEVDDLLGPDRSGIQTKIELLDGDPSRS